MWAPTLQTGDRVVEGALTWEYVGLTRDVQEPFVVPEGYTRDNVHREDRGWEAIRRHDRNGRTWRVVQVDEAMAAELVARYDLEAAEPLSLPQPISPDSGDSDTGAEDGSSEEEEGWIDFESYSKVKCTDLYTSGANVSNHVWSNGLEDVIVNSEMSTYETDPVVAIYGGQGIGQTCSGVLIRSDIVLTAAHCLAINTDILGLQIDTGGNAPPEGYFNLDGFDFCVRGNWNGASPSCARSEYFDVNDDFSAGSSVTSKLDWALVKLSSEIGGSNNTMYLSSASSSTIRAADITLGGYPGMWRSDGGCTQNWKASNAEYSSRVNGWGSRLHLSEGEADTVYAQSVLMDLTHGDGYSGGVYFYDPGTTGGRRYSVGLHSGAWWGVSGVRSTKGPRTSYWRSTWITAMGTSNFQ